MPSSTRSYKHRVAGGVAAYLADNSLAAWDDFGDGTAYSSGTAWPIFIGPDMPALPHRLIVLTPTVQSFMRADVMTTIQIRIRGAQDAIANEVENKAQDIHDLFYPNGFPLVHTLLGDVRAGVVFPGDMLPLDPDSQRRHGHIQSIRIRSRRPAAE